MSKNKLVGEYVLDFELFGIVCNIKEYRLAWHINQTMNITLQKQDDIRIEYADKTSILISNFLHQSDYQSIELLQNKLVSGGNLKMKFLIPELQQFDFLLKVKDETGELDSENINTMIKGIHVVEYAMRLNFDNLKSKENLLF